MRQLHAVMSVGWTMATKTGNIDPVLWELEAQETRCWCIVAIASLKPFQMTDIPGGVLGMSRQVSCQWSMALQQRAGGRRICLLFRG
jgi:hypothetical protein